MSQHFMFKEIEHGSDQLHDGYVAQTYIYIIFCNSQLPF